MSRYITDTENVTVCNIWYNVTYELVMHRNMLLQDARYNDESVL